jgi:hypothetical protein
MDRTLMTNAFQRTWSQTNNIQSLYRRKIVIDNGKHIKVLWSWPTTKFKYKNLSQISESKFSKKTLSKISQNHFQAMKTVP